MNLLRVKDCHSAAFVLSQVTAHTAVDAPHARQQSPTRCDKRFVHTMLHTQHTHTDTHVHTEEHSVEHTLSMHLMPGSSRLRDAQLSPEGVDISREVEYAKQRNGSLPLLVNAVRGKLRANYKCSS